MKSHFLICIQLGNHLHENAAQASYRFAEREESRLADKKVSNNSLSRIRSYIREIKIGLRVEEYPKGISK